MIVLADLQPARLALPGRDSKRSQGALSGRHGNLQVVFFDGNVDDLAILLQNVEVSRSWTL